MIDTIDGWHRDFRDPREAHQDGLTFSGVRLPSAPSLVPTAGALSPAHIPGPCSCQSSSLSPSSASCPYPTADSEMLLDHVAGWIHLGWSAIGLRSIPEADYLTCCCAARACPAVCMSIRQWPVTLTGCTAAWVQEKCEQLLFQLRTVQLLPLGRARSAIERHGRHLR